MMLMNLMALLVTTLVSGDAQERRDLVEVDSGEAYGGGTYVASIDRASRKKVAEGIAVTQHYVFSKPREDGAVDAVTEYVVDCAMPQYKTIRDYRVDRAGKLISEAPITRLNGEWRYAARPGMSQKIVDAVCTG